VRKTFLLYLSLLAALCPRALAQTDSGRDVQLQQRLQQLQTIDIDQRFLVNPEIPPDQRLLLDYGGFFQPQYYSIDDVNNVNHSLFQPTLVGYLRANFDGANEIFMRLSVSYDQYNSGGSFDGFGSRLVDPDFDRAYYKFDLDRYESAYNGKLLNYDVSFEGGRDLVYWGNGLVMGQVLDGVMPSFSYGPLALNVIAGITPLRTVDIQPDRPGFSFNTKRGFYGALLNATLPNIPIHPYVYGIVQRDYNSDNQSLQDDIITNYGYDSDYIGAGATGELGDHVHYGLEAAWEGGKTLSDSSAVEGFELVQIPQTWNRIEAWAGDIKIDYAPQDLHNSRLMLEGIAASGDPNRGLTNTTFNGSAPYTDDHAFNAFGLVSTGLAFGAPVSNLAIMRFGASTFPWALTDHFRRLQLGMDIYWINKENARAPIDEASNNVTYLGWEPDFYLNWEVTSDLTLTERYGIFMPNEAAFGNDKARQFLYTGAIIAF
jgi:hypothetical protein